MELGLLLFAFLTYLYLPHVLFRVFAERYVDLGRRVDSTQIGEVVSAIIPSLILNLFAVATIWLVELILPYQSFQSRGPDWHTFMSTIFEPEGWKRLATILDDPYQWMFPAAYFLILVAITFINGTAYGRGVRIGMVSDTLPLWRIYPHCVRMMQGFLGKRHRGWRRWRRRVGFWFSVGTYGFWKRFFEEYRVPLFSMTALNPHMYVRTEDGLIYHGRFVDYEKATDGSIDTIVIDEVTRVLKDAEKFVASGENPLRILHGTLYIKWKRISDINTVAPDAIEKLWTFYEDAATKNRGTGTRRALDALRRFTIRRKKKTYR